MTRRTRLIRIKKLKEAIAAGDRNLVDQLVADEWPNRQSARKFLERDGVELPRKQNFCRKLTSGRSFVIIADLINTDDPYAEIAERHNVSRQYVEEVAKRCDEAGIKQ